MDLNSNPSGSQAAARWVTVLRPKGSEFKPHLANGIYGYPFWSMVLSIQNIIQSFHKFLFS